MKKGIDYIGNAVVYFCHDGEGNVLMAQRSQNSRDELGRWDIGGGGVEFGDDVEDTVRKEIKEEYSTDVKELQFLGFRDVHREHNGVATHWITLDFKVLVDRSMAKIGELDKFDNLGWFTLDTLPHPSTLSCLFFSRSTKRSFRLEIAVFRVKDDKPKSQNR